METCDRCSAAGTVIVELRAGTLHFCGHHFRQHADVLRQVAVKIKEPADVIF